MGSISVIDVNGTLWPFKVNLPATTAWPWANSMAPKIIDVTPVAQAEIGDVIGPVAWVNIDIFPPTILIHEFGLV